MTVLVTDTWAGPGGALDGKVPTTGGGTWVNTDANANYNFGSASAVAVGSTDVRHSASVADCRIGGRFTFAFGNSLQVEGRLWLRADSSFQNGYYARFLEGGGYSGVFTSVSIYRRVSGGDTQIANQSLAPSSLLTLSQSHYFQAVGSTLSIGYGNSVLLSTSDATISSGFPGFSVRKGENGEETFDTALDPVTIETPYVDVSTAAFPRAVTRGLTSTISVGYLGAADIALISQSILATLQANTIPVNVEKMNNAEVIGTGTSGDAWRGVGVLP